MCSYFQLAKVLTEVVSLYILRKLSVRLSYDHQGMIIHVSWRILFCGLCFMSLAFGKEGPSVLMTARRTRDIYVSRRSCSLMNGFLSEPCHLIVFLTSRSNCQGLFSFLAKRFPCELCCLAHSFCDFASCFLRGSHFQVPHASPASHIASIGTLDPSCFMLVCYFHIAPLTSDSEWV